MKLFSISLASSLAEVKRDVQQKPRFLSFQKMAKKTFHPQQRKHWEFLASPNGIFCMCHLYVGGICDLGEIQWYLWIDEPRGPSKQDQEIKIDVKKVMTCFLPCFSSGFCHTSCFSWHSRVFEKGRNQRKMGDQISDDFTFYTCNNYKNSPTAVFFFVAKSPSSKKIDLKTSSLDILCSWACLVYVQL